MNLQVWKILSVANIVRFFCTAPYHPLNVQQGPHGLGMTFLLLELRQSSFVRSFLPTSLPLHSLPVAVQRLHPVHRLFVPTQQAQLTVGVAVLLLIQCVRICLSVCGVCGKIGRHADGQTDRQTDTDRWIQQTPTKWCLGYSVRYSMWHRRD